MLRCKVNSRPALLAMIIVCGLFISGCAEHRRKESLNLYVDAVMLSDLSDHDKALKKLDKATKLNPDFAMAYSLKGDIFQEQGKFEESSDAYEQATKFDPWSFKDFFNLGKVNQVLERYNKAVTAYVRACEIKPEHYDSHLNAAKCYYEVDNYDQAVEYSFMAKQRAKEDDQKSAAESLLGDVFEAQKDHDQAIAAYRRALEVEGNNPKIMVSLAVSYLRTNRYEAARELLLSAAEIDPDFGMAWQYLGFTYIRLQDVDKAVDSYKKAVKLDEKDWMAHKGLGVAYILKALNSADGTDYKAMGIAEWKISLRIKEDQPKLRLLLDKYTHETK